MAVKFIALMLLASAALVAASCPSQCSGHGTCGSNDRCSCYTQTGTSWGSRVGWTGADCSLRTCPLAVAWDQISTQSNRLFPTLFEGASASTDLLVAYKDASFNEAEDKTLLVKLSTVTDAGSGGADTVKFRWKYSTDDDYSTEVTMTDSQFTAYQIGTGPSGTGSGIRIFFDSSKAAAADCGFEDFEATTWTLTIPNLFAGAVADEFIVEDELDDSVMRLTKSDGDQVYLVIDFIPWADKNQPVDGDHQAGATVQIEEIDIPAAAGADGGWLYIEDTAATTVKCGMWFNRYSIEGVVVNSNAQAPAALLAFDPNPTEIKVQTGETAVEVASRVTKHVDDNCITADGADFSIDGGKTAHFVFTVDAAATVSDFHSKDIEIETTKDTTTVCISFDTGAAGYDTDCPTVADGAARIATSITGTMTAAQIATAIFNELTNVAFCEQNSLVITCFSTTAEAGYDAAAEDADNLSVATTQGVAPTHGIVDTALTATLTAVSTTLADYDEQWIVVYDEAGNSGLAYFTADGDGNPPSDIPTTTYGPDEVDLTGLGTAVAIIDAIEDVIEAFATGDSMPFTTDNGAADAISTITMDNDGYTRGIVMSPGLSADIMTLTSYTDGRAVAGEVIEITQGTNNPARRVRSSFDTVIQANGFAAFGDADDDDDDNWATLRIGNYETTTAIADRLEAIFEAADTGNGFAWGATDVTSPAGQVVAVDDSVTALVRSTGNEAQTVSTYFDKYFDLDVTNEGGGGAESTSITFLTDGNNLVELQSKHVLLHDDSVSTDATTAFWFDVDSAGTDPNAGDVDVEVDIADGSSAVAVATALYDAAVVRVSAGGGTAATRSQEWVVSRSGATVTISNTENGRTADASTDIDASDATLVVDQSYTNTDGQAEVTTVTIASDIDVSAGFDDTFYFHWCTAAGKCNVVVADADSGGDVAAAEALDSGGGNVQYVVKNDADSAFQTAEKIRAAAAAGCLASGGCSVELSGTSIVITNTGVGAVTSSVYAVTSAQGSVTVTTQGVDAMTETQTCAQEHWAGLVAVNDLWTITVEHNEGIDYVDNDDNTAHQKLECAGRGLCDRKSGQCECFTGYTGEACARTTCPGDCNGHGVCQDLRRFAADAGNDYDGAWDSYKHMGCLCDGGYRGPDCSMIECPSGDDPLGADGGSAGRDCSGRGVCDYSTGQCGCFKGYFGERCESQTNYV